jgi:hypothetical protein
MKLYSTKTANLLFRVKSLTINYVADVAAFFGPIYQSGLLRTSL